MKLSNLFACVLPVVTIAATTIACSAPDGEAANSSEDRIIGGTATTVQAWPGTVALYKNGIQACGGALVAPRWVLTAGHCVTLGLASGGFQKVVINRTSLSAAGGETLSVIKATRHPSYNGSTQDNDLSLLQLSAASTSPITKIGSPAQQALVVAQANVTTVGWGLTSEFGSATSDVLRQVTVPVIANQTCKGYSGYSGVTNNMICAALAQGGKDSCQGDSGSPLFISDGTSNYDVGLTSWGIGCARAGQPGVYTRIGNYLDWIKQTSNNEVVIGGGTTTTGTDAGTDTGTDAGTVTSSFTPFSGSGSVVKDQTKAFSFNAPAGKYAVDMRGTSGDADLYVKANSAATLTSYDCRPYQQGSNEHCDVTLTAAGTINIMVNGYASGSSPFTLTGAQE